MGTVRAADISEVITCYGHDGSAWANNTRCPGSDACGGIDAHVYRTDCVTNLKTDLGPGHTLSGYQIIATTAGSASQTPSPTPKSDPNDNNAVKISEGVGIFVGAIAIGAIGAIGALFFMRCGKRARASTSAQELPNKGGQKGPRTPGCRPNPRN
ncbi:hypothetical protein MAJ_07318, partial [Metarhizium majus ARSEF 297]